MTCIAYCMCIYILKRIDSFICIRVCCRKHRTIRSQDVSSGSFGCQKFLSLGVISIIHYRRTIIICKMYQIYRYRHKQRRENSCYHIHLNTWCSRQLSLCQDRISVDIKSLQKSKHQHSSQNRTTAVADQRQGNSCQRNKLRITAYRQENLENIHDTQSIRSIFQERLFTHMGNVYYLQEKADTYGNQTDSIQNTILFTNCGENEILLHIRNRPGRPCIYSHAEPASCSNCKQRLRYLITGSADICPWILPGCYTYSDVRE